MSNSPNFLLVGGAKCGSTSLYYLLNQHPEIFMPKFKEPLYFISDIIKNISNKDMAFKNEGLKDKFIHSKSDYFDLFKNVKNETSIGEASATYLYYYKQSIPKIKKELIDPKIIIILRNPIEKSFSQYKHLQKLNAEDRSFEKGLELEEERIAQNYTAMYHYKSQSLYYEQVKAFFLNFSNVLVVLTEELKNDPILLSKRCYDFLNVDVNFIPEIKMYNVTSKRIKNRYIHSKIYNKQAHSIKMFFKFFIGNSAYQIITNKYKKKNIGEIDIKITEDEKVELKKYFKYDIEKLEKLLKKDLNNWK
jgi:sulfotransferase family protein